MKMLLGIALSLSGFVTFSRECDSTKVVIETTKNVVKVYSQMPEFSSAKKIANYKLALIHSGSETIHTYSIAALNKKMQIIALGASSVDTSSCQLVENEDSSQANSLSFLIKSY